MKKTNQYSFPCRNLLKVFIVFSFSFLVQNVNAQEITYKDSQEITSRSKELLQNFNQLINLLTSPLIDDATSKELIANSFAKNDSNALFLNDNVILEDDIDPNHFDYKTSSDVNVKTYFKNIDLFLKKDTVSSIVFSDVRVSNVKLGDFLYVKVFFKSLFRTNHKEIKKTYVTTERVVDMRAEIVNKKWKVYIVLVSFVKPENLENSFKNDVIIVENENRGGAITKAVLSEDKPKETEEERKNRALFQENVSSGDSALKVQNYSLAIIAYQKAKGILPLDKTINPKLQNAQKLHKEQIASAKRKLEEEDQKRNLLSPQKNTEENKDSPQSEKTEYSEDEIKEIEKQLLTQEKLDKITFNATDGNANQIFTGICLNSKKVIGLGSDKKIRIWNATNGELINKIDIVSNFSPTTVLKIANVNKDGSLLAIANQDESMADRLSIYDLNSEKIINKFLIPPFPVQNIEFNGDGQKIILVFKNKLLQIFNVKTGSVEKAVNFDYYITNVVYSPTGSQIYVNTQNDFQIINVK
jgi:WD40 repeat protein